MPRATTSGEETQRYELKSCDGGYVVIRRLTFGQYLQRRDMASNIRIMASQNGGRQQDIQGEVVSALRAITEYEFAHCITEHNLEDENGNMLDFRKPMNVHRLDPRIGGEIDTYINEMNQFDDEKLENLELMSEEAQS